MGKEFKGFKKFKPEDVSQDDVEKVVKSHMGKSENELMGEILEKYTEGIKNGTMSKDELDKFANNAKNFLTPEQMQKLRTIINKLKSH